jgi:hypothetical protein
VGFARLTRVTRDAQVETEKVAPETELIPGLKDVLGPTA